MNNSKTKTLEKVFQINSTKFQKFGPGNKIYYLNSEYYTFINRVVATKICRRNYNNFNFYLLYNNLKMFFI